MRVHTPSSSRIRRRERRFRQRPKPRDRGDAALPRAAATVILSSIEVKFSVPLPLRSRALSFKRIQAYFSRISTRRFLSSDAPFWVGTSGLRLPRATMEALAVSIPLALRIATTLIAR
jgi:hypothetical protein